MLLCISVQPVQYLLHVGNHQGGVVRVGVEAVRAFRFQETDDAFLRLHGGDIEASKAADLGIGVRGALGRGRCHEGFARVLLVGIGPAADGDAELLVGAGLRPVFDILLRRCRSGLGVRFGLFGLGEFLLGFHLTGPVCHVQVFQLLDIRLQLHLLQNERAAGCQGFHFRCGEGDFSGVLHFAADVLAVHDGPDKAALPVDDIPKAGVKAALGDVHILADFLVDVALPEGSAVALIHVAGSPRGVKVMDRHDALLRVHADAHLAGAADQDAHLAVVHVRKELGFLRVGVRVVDEGNLFRRDAELHKAGFQVIVELGAARVHFHVLLLCRLGAVALALRRRHITEDDLRALDILAGLVLLCDFLSAHIDFAALFIGEGRINHALRVGNLSAVRRDLQHVVLAGVNILDVVGSLGKRFHVALLELSGLALHDLDRAALHLRDFQAGYLGQNVREVAEQELQLVHVLEAGEALLDPVALPGGFDLHAVDHFAELLCPCVEGGQAHLFQKVGLQVLLHDVHLAHAVHDRRSRRKHDAAPAVELLEIAHLGIEVKGPLAAVLVSEPCDIVHGRGVEQVLEVVRFVHKDAVDAELFKLDAVGVLCLAGEFLYLRFELLALLLHILDRHGVFPALFLGLVDGLNDLVDLLLIERDGEAVGDGDFLELLIGDDDRVIVSCGNPVCEGLAVGRGEVALLCHKDFRGREVGGKFFPPLSDKGFRHGEHRFVHNAELFHLHGGRCHFHGFARADAVGEEGVAAAGDNPLHGVCLMGFQAPSRPEAVHGQGAAVVFRGDKVVESLVV